MSIQSSIEAAVILSVYRNDSPDHFETALLSVLEQECSEWLKVKFYIGVDGPITDQLEAVIAKYQDSIHHIHRSSKNLGLGAMLNMLIRELGDEQYVFRMDADDISLPGRFLKQIEFMERHPDCGVSGTNIIEFDEGKKDSDRLVEYPESYQNPIAQFSKRSPIAHVTACIRRSTLETTGGYPPLKFNEDIGLWFICLERGIVFRNIPKPFVKVRITSAFYSRRSANKAFEEFKTYINGIFRIKGICVYMLYPPIRLIFRLSPKALVRFGYRLRSSKNRP